MLVLRACLRQPCPARAGALSRARAAFSSSVSMDQIRRLRVASGAPIADCKAALSDSEVAGDIDKAFQWLRKKGKAAASRMAGRDAKEGLIGVRVNGKVGTIVEVNSETDFVARNERFAEFVDTVAESSIALSNAGGQIEVADLLASSVPGGGGIVSDALGDTVSVIRENVSIGRAASVECDEGGVVGAYVHAGGKAAALVALNGAGADANQLELAARRLAMHCVAAKPLYLSESDVPPAAIEREKKILTDQALQSGKAANVIERMVQGRMSKFFEEATLLGQAHMVEEGNPKVRRTLEALAMMQKYSHPFTNPIWYPDKPPQVSKYMASLSKKLGVTVTVSAFQRFAVGEGGNNE